MFDFRRGSTVSVLFLASAIIWTASTKVDAGPSEAGKQLYMQYCSACHGAEGKGDGVVSGLMDPHPTDLTKLNKAAGGKFPFQEVLRAIDGRETYRAHGNPDMPVWGEIFRDDTNGRDVNKEALARGKAALITDYLSSIQDWK